MPAVPIFHGTAGAPLFQIVALYYQYNVFPFRRHVDSLYAECKRVLIPMSPPPPTERPPSSPNTEAMPINRHSVQGAAVPPAASPSALPKRRASLRERFWTVSSANAFKEEDRERRARQGPRESYIPRHAAADFSTQMATPRAAAAAYRHDMLAEEEGTPGGDDYALFVERSEMLHEADEAAAAARTRSQKRRSFGRRIADYVKPPREER